MVIEIISCVLGTIAFSVIMKVPKNSLIIVAIGGTISATIERMITGFYGDFAGCLISMICLSFYCEFMARIVKIPTTVILMPSTIPLLPGSSIYYAMFYATQSDTKLFVGYIKLTLYAGLGIALGAVISSTVIKIINYYKTET
ncbi:MAG: threonine/serine exporter family protein [Eubacterium sp.]|nr:threonine/serine exporter family protein [Eubacterium sp.]